MTTRILLALGLLAGLATSCVVSPQPSPPDVILDGIKIGPSDTVEVLGGVIGFAAEPGTVTPAEGVVIITNLDTTDAPSTAKVEPDGSFALAVPGENGQRFRFQAKVQDTRSQPFDLTVSPSGVTLSATADAPECLVLTPARWAALDGDGDARSIVIRNECSAPVLTATPRLRRGLAGFSFSPTPAIALDPGAITTLTVHAGGSGEVEDVLLIDVTAPAKARRAVTLTVPDR